MTNKNLPLADGEKKIISPVVATANATAAPQPEFLRLPKTGHRDWLTGLSRSGLNALILGTKDNGFRPRVKSVVLRRPGALRGTRLIVVESLREYLHDNLQPEEGQS